MATSSSLAKNYDVFLSFRGIDTRKNIVSCLYEFLCLRGLFTFKDDERLELGDDISDKLREAIQTSWFAVIVTSQNYATSSWCLEELRLIMELHKEKQIEVVPIFYGVEPTVVRHRSGSFETALEKHRNSASEMKMEKVKRWEEALVLLSGLSGQDSTTCVDDAEMIATVVESISTRLRIMKPAIDLMNLVGMKTHMDQIDPLLDFKSENECLMLGIWGMGGIGKTTIAKCLYARFSQGYQAHCFLENICQIFNQGRPQDLQRELLSNLTRDDNIRLWSVEAGCQEIKSRLRHKKVFVVLDGVDRVEQIRALAQEASWFGPGSRIIITTRDIGLLNSCKVKRVYKVKCLEHKDALHIFKQTAFGAGIPASEGFEHLAVRASQLAHGLPSALVAFGLHLSQNTSIQDWENELEILEKSPHEDVQKIFMTSYDGLEQRDKIVFLHVACLFNKGYFRHIITFFDNGDSRIKRLAAKSLVNISPVGWINMHFLVVQAGREIVCRESESEPSAQRVLWDPREILDVLENNIGSDRIEGLALEMCKMNDRLPMHLRDTAFSPMHSLKYLKFFEKVGDTESQLNLISKGYGRSCKLKLLHWDAYPSLFFPSTFRIDTLVELNLRDSNLLSLWKDPWRLDNLRRIDVRGSTKLLVLPDLVTAVNLEELIVEGCRNLVRTPGPITSKYLRKLNMINCDRLWSIMNVEVRQESNPNCMGIHQIILIFLDTKITLSALTDLSIEGQISIELLGLKGRAEHLSYSLAQIPHEQIGLVTPLLVPDTHGLESLDIKWYSYNIGRRHSFSCRSFSKLPYLTELKLINLNIEEIPEDINELQLLKTLDLSGNDFLYLPTTMGQLAKLKYLSLHRCPNLKALPQLTQVETLILSHCKNLRSLVETGGVEQAPNGYRLLTLCLDNCKGFDSLSDELSHFTNLEYLDLSNHEFDTIPESIKDFLNLRTLSLKKCKNLKVLNGIPHSLKYLYAHGCNSLLHLSLFANHSIKHLDLSHCFKLDSQMDLIIPFLYDKHSQGVTPSLLCVPVGRSIYIEEHERYRGIKPPFPNNHKLLGFAILFQIVTMKPLHLEFPGFNFSWQWRSHLLGSQNRELIINLKPNFYIPTETKMEKGSNWSHVVMIHIPNTINDEESDHRNVQFRVYLQHPLDFQIPLPEILFCKARKIFENCDWEQPLETVTSILNKLY